MTRDNHVPLAEALKSAPVFVDGDWIESKDQDPNGDVRLIQLADIGVGCFIDKSRRYLTTDAAHRLGCTFLERGDVLIARMPDPIGRACVFPGVGQLAVTAVDVCIVRVDAAVIDSKYLVHFLNSSNALRQVSSKSSGSTRKRISRSNLGTIEIPLPPLEEQRRIAAILDKAHEIQVADRKRRETLGRFQASYFRYLFGEPSKTTENWSLKTITSCCKSIQTGPFGSLLHQSDCIQGGIPIINPKHIINGVVSCGENETITEDKAEELSSYRLEEGDVLLARRGEMGRCAAITRRENGYLCGTGSMFLRPLRDALAPEYLAALLSSKHMRSKLERVAIGTTLLNLNSTIVGDVLIPVPPIELKLRYARFLGGLMPSVISLLDPLLHAQLSWHLFRKVYFPLQAHESHRSQAPPDPGCRLPVHHPD